jgi:hypothetical protein
MRSAAALLVAGLLHGCAARSTPAAPAVASPAPVVHDLRTLADLSVPFDRDRDHPRIVLLLSPT